MLSNCNWGNQAQLKQPCSFYSVGFEFNEAPFTGSALKYSTATLKWHMQK